MDEAQAPPDAAGPLGDDARAVLGAAQDAAGAYAGAFAALQTLVRAELALAREALLRALLLAVLAGVMIATAWGLLAALSVAGLRSLGLPLPAAIALPMLASAGLALWAMARARAALGLAGFPATRRQVARLWPRDRADAGAPAEPSLEPSPGTDPAPTADARTASPADAPGRGAVDDPRNPPRP